MIEPTTEDAAALVATGGVERFGTGVPGALTGTEGDGLADAGGVAEPTIVARTTTTIPMTDASDFRLVDCLACIVKKLTYPICLSDV